MVNFKTFTTLIIINTMMIIEMMRVINFKTFTTLIIVNTMMMIGTISKSIRRIVERETTKIRVNTMKKYMY